MNTVSVNGWQVKDSSYSTRGSDPTQVFVVELKKSGKSITVTEFFGDYSMVVCVGSSSKESPRDLTTSQVDTWLDNYGAPRIKAIENALYESFR